MLGPTCTIVIPGFNRPEPLKQTLRSVTQACRRLAEPTEVLLIDDGSQPPLRDQLAEFDPGLTVSWLQQANQGSIVARATGIAAATGEFVLLLDSDDLIHPDKLVRHVETMRRTGADISYCDYAVAVFGADHAEARFADGTRLRTTADPIEFFLALQPLPHVPVYRRSYLQRCLRDPIVPVDRRMDPSGDIWLYYNLISYPATIAKVDGALSAVGPHEAGRFSDQWEKLSAASLLIAETFQRQTAGQSAHAPARAAVARCAFESWRRLPYDFDDRFQHRLLAIWRQTPAASLIGGRYFTLASRLLGPVAAGRLFRRLTGQPYRVSRTLDGAELAHLFATLNL